MYVAPDDAVQDIDSGLSNEDLIHSRRELLDLAACLANYKARSYFRLFLSREFNVENIAFWEAVQEYKVSVSEI